MNPKQSLLHIVNNTIYIYIADCFAHCFRDFDCTESAIHHISSTQFCERHVVVAIHDQRVSKLLQHLYCLYLDSI